MTFKLKLFLFILTVILLVAIAILWLNTEKKEYQPGISAELDQIVSQAQYLYRDSKRLKVNLDVGPCITNSLKPDWVVDLVHEPRLPLDDLPENQCQAYVEGQAKHFVELDLDGNLVRVR